MQQIAARVPLKVSDDPALPGLAVLCQPEELTAMLSRVLGPCLVPDARLLECRSYLHRLAPGKRSSVELELVVGNENGVPTGHRRLLGKLYRDEQGATVYETLRELRSHGLGVGRFIVPQPLAYVPEHHLLLLNWAEGELLNSVILTRSNAGREIEGAAAWLLGLHKCGVQTGRRYSFLAHLQTLAQWKELIAAVYPEGERLLGSLLACFEERGKAVAGWIPGPIHRDFSPEHLVVLGHQFTGLDFDEFCQYDPLFDVAHFRAHLGFLGLTHFGTLNHFDTLAERFLSAYQAAGGEYAEDRLRLYTSIAYFKLCRFVGLVQRAEPWRQFLPELLSEARGLV